MTPSPSGSLAAAVDGMLEHTIAFAMAHTPLKRKLQPAPEQAADQGQQAAASSAGEAEDIMGDLPPAKHLKAAADEPAAAAAASPAPLAAVVPVPQPLVLPAPRLALATETDLEAALGELLGTESSQHVPRTQPIEAAVVLEPAPTSAAAAPTSCVSLPEPAAEPSDGTTADIAEAELLATHPCGGAAAAAGTAPTGTATAAADGAGQLSAPMCCRAPQRFEPTAAATVLLPAITASPALAHHPLPTTNSPITELLPVPPAPEPPAAVCLPAAAASSPPPAGGSAQDAPTPTAPAYSSKHINLLRGDTEQWGGETQAEPSSGSSLKLSMSESDSPHPSSGAVKAPSGQRQPPARVGDYTLQGRYCGSGGLGTVYPAVHQPTGQAVALKLGTPFAPSEGRNDFTWTTFRAEWNCYTQLADKALPWAPEPFEFGLVQDGGGVAPWITMSLLGPSLHSLNRRLAPPGSSPTGLPHLAAYARSMLVALEGLHAQGYTHNDIKPANFVAPRGFDAAAAAAGAPPHLYLIDYGFAQRVIPALAGCYQDFVGTPDFASSAALQSLRPGLRDDLEALGYTLVELALGELPWDITQKSSGQGRLGDSGGWNQKQLYGMLVKRNGIWDQLCGQGAIPTWLVSWVGYCINLPASAVPDYDVLRELIAQGELEAAVAAAAAKAKVVAPGGAWAMLEAEQ